MKSPLTFLRNIGPTNTRWLESVGIRSPGDLFNLGPVEANKRVKSAYPREVSLNMLYALQGAIMDLPWNELPADIKDKLKREVAD